HMLFAFAVGLLFSTSAVYFRDTENIVNLLLTFWFFASPVFYQVDSVVQKLPELFQGISPSLGVFMLSLYLLNTLVPLLQMYQSIFYHFQMPLWNHFVLFSVWTILLLGMSLSLFPFIRGNLRKNYESGSEGRKSFQEIPDIYRETREPAGEGAGKKREI
ncbi:MAG: ABC transporter permease, partial [bacterium]